MKRARSLTLQTALLLALTGAALAAAPASHAEDTPQKPADPRVFDYLAFAGEHKGIVARLTLDAASGKIVSQQELFSDSDIPVFHNLEQSPGGRFLVFSNLQNNASWIFVLRREGAELKARRVDLGERGMFHDLTATTAAVAGNKGGVFLVDLEQAKVVKSADISDALDPKAHQFGGIRFSPDGKRLALLCMIDSPTGNRVGGRVAILDAATLAVLHDLKIPHLFPQLHYGPGSKHNNPVPVGLAISHKSGTAAIVLENYGGLLLTSASKLFDGNLSDAVFIPTSKSGAPGEGFPTRAIFFEHNGREYLLGDSASADGGLTLIDPVKKERLGWIDSGPESIGGFGVLTGSRAYAFRSGIRAERGATETVSKHTERAELLLFDLSPLDGGGLPAVEVVPFDKFLYFAHPLGDAEGRFLLLASLSKGEDRSLKISVYDTIERKLTDVQESLGVLRGFVPVPTQP